LMRETPGNRAYIVPVDKKKQVWSMTRNL
jgi:hypothetical protein